MPLEEICKNLGRNRRSVTLFLHRHRNNPALIEKDNLLLRILRLKFQNPELFNPARSFLDTVGIGQKRFHAMYKGKERMTDDECKRICLFFSIELSEVMDIRQTSLFPEEEALQSETPAIPEAKEYATQLNFLEMDKKKRVIDLDSMKVIELFDEKDSLIIEEKYQNIEKYGFVGFDQDGDLTVSEK